MEGEYPYKIISYMIVIRNNSIKIGQKEFTLKRKITHGILKARTKLADKLTQAATKEGTKAGQISGYLNYINSGEKNGKALDFLNKTAAKRGIIITNHDIQGIGMGNSSIGGVIPDKSTSTIIKNASKERYRKGLNREGRKLERLSEIMADENNPRMLVRIPKGCKTGIAYHEVGHATPTKKIRRRTKDPVEQRKLHAEYMREHGIKNAKMAYSTPGSEHVSNMYKISRDVIKEEKRASKEGLKLLKEAKKEGKVSKKDLKDAKFFLNVSRKSYKHAGKSHVLSSLAQKVQIPSRRIPFGAYKSTLTDKRNIRFLDNGHKW